MGELNEKELLILSNYAYFNCSKNEGTIGDNINELKDENGNFSKEKVNKQGAVCSNMSEDEAIDLLERIDEDDNIKSLYMQRSINNGDLRGILYTDKKDNATLVFRGTGGTYDAWYDNVTGEYETDTKIQTLASDFVKYECGMYKNVTVTGHSKGGNLSQYVTVMNPDIIDRCVSYDGQGFSKSFLNEYEDKIDAVSGRITSISACNDFVNILLFSIAGTRLFVNNDGKGADGHSSYTMLNSAVFDENGNFSRENDVTSQSILMKLAKRAGDGIVSAIDMLPGDGNEKASNVLASLVASVMSSDKGEEYEKSEIKNSIEAFKIYGGEMLGIIDKDYNVPNVSYAYTSISTDKVKSAYAVIYDRLDMLYGIPETLEDVLVRLDFNIMGRSYTEAALKRTIERTDRLIKMSEKLCDTLRDIIVNYEKYDNEILEDVKAMC